MTRRHNSKEPTLLLLALAAPLLLALTGCERKVEGTVPVQSDQCFSCHSGYMDAMQGEWANSVHASGASVDYTSRSAPNDCQRCHNQDGFITWITDRTIIGTPSNATAIGCFACHDPHGTGQLEPLRTEAPVTMLTGATFNLGRANICANCHQIRTWPTITNNYEITDTRFGPHHGPQGDLLLGTGGYTGFPGFVAGDSKHWDELDDGCVTCHMGYAQTHEGYGVGGHSFNMLDEDGNSLVANCTASSCHGGGTFAFTKSTNSLEPYDVTLTADPVDWDNDGTVEGYQTEMEGMLDSLGTLLELKGIYDPTPPSGSGNAVKGTYADGNLVGAYWNFITVEEDRSMGIHNWEYMRSIIQASIDYVSAMP